MWGIFAIFSSIFSSKDAAKVYLKVYLAKKKKRLTTLGRVYLLLWRNWISIEVCEAYLRFLVAFLVAKVYLKTYLA